MSRTATQLHHGERYGRLVVISAAGKSKDNRQQYLCKCDCGKETIVVGKHLVSGNTKSCGCYKRDAGVIANTTHGMSKTRIYKTWASMKDRCEREKSNHYANYGGRGITVCDEWRNDFKAFCDWALSNGYADNLTIDRIDVNKNYCPDNCRWVLANEQAKNKRKTIYLTKDGETRLVKEWAQILGIPAYTIYSRKELGFSDEECLFVGSLPKRDLKVRGANVYAIHG